MNVIQASVHLKTSLGEYFQIAPYILPLNTLSDLNTFTGYQRNHTMQPFMIGKTGSDGVLS